MKKPDVTYVLGSAFIAFTSLFYCCTMWFAIKLPRYYPLEHTWKWIKEKDVPSQGWYGMQAFAFLAAGIVTFIIYLVLKRVIPVKKDLEPAQRKILGVVATLTVIICLGYMLYYEFNRWGVFATMGLQ